MKLCVVAPNGNIYSETFIHSHMHHLNVDTVNLVGEGSFFPQRVLNGKILHQPNIFQKASRRILEVSASNSQLIDKPKEQALCNYLKQQKVDVVLAEYGPTGVAVSSACENARIPLVVHFHGYDAFQYSTVEKHKKGYARLFDRAALLIAASQSMANQLCTIGASHDRIAVNHYGVNVSKFKGGDPSIAPPHFVAVGRFVEKKAPQLTVLAFQKVLEHVPSARLTMIGDGPLLEACRQIIFALNLEEQISLLGSRSPDEIVEHFKEARAFVQHSLRTSSGDSESLGVVFLEAGAMSLPSVGTKHDGIPEVIVEGETGLLVEEGNIQTYANHMITLAKDPQLAKTLGEAARQRIERDFSEEKSLSNLHKILSSVVENR